jgi:NAD(P)-dependent dehydrogenase (short-subunit alcohol dehydrogenase family)
MPLIDALLDGTVVLSFDRSGYARHAARFDPTDLDVDLRGQVVLVTGATSGLGLASAHALARLGASLHLLVRDERKGREAQRAIRAASANRQVRVDVLDVADLASVRAFARRFEPERVDALVHNAGVLPAAREETADGIELTLATHVVGPFLLTALLQPRLERAPSARVVWVSSGGMYTQRLSLDDVRWTRRPYDGVAAYAQTKRAQVALARTWAEHLADTRVTVSAMHPGWADTPGVRGSLPRFFRVMRTRLRTPDEGADTIVWLAASPRAAGRSGLFWFDREPVSPYLLPGTRESADDRRALWELCERLTRPHDRSRP